jgi:hypothetical protein
MGRSQRHKVENQGFASNGEAIAEGSAHPAVLQVLARAAEYPVSLSFISPTEAAVGDGDLVLTATGANFTQNNVITFDGVEEVTEWVSENELTMVVKPSEATPGTFPVAVRYRGVPGFETDQMTFTFTDLPTDYETPTIVTMSPLMGPVGSPDVEITVTGTGFAPVSVIMWDGVELTTTFTDETQVSATAPVSQSTVAGQAEVRVATGGEQSNPVYFTFTAAGR